MAVVDRTTGQRLASSGGQQQYISESIVKLFTVAYYVVEHDGHLDQDLTDTLQYMIIHSDDHIESELWNTDIVPTMAERYHLSHTSNGPKTGPHDWGWELITADDEADFLYRMSKDPEVAPILLPAMRQVATTGSDGFDQDFGMNALSGDHGSKQGWTDVGSADEVQIHSVGWTEPLLCRDPPDFDRGRLRHHADGLHRHGEGRCRRGRAGRRYDGRGHCTQVDADCTQVDADCTQVDADFTQDRHRPHRSPRPR